MKIEELEQYRNEEGFINIDRTSFVARPEDREVRGSIEREKDWMKLEDTSILLRTELFKDEEEKNYCNYAELIFEELSKQVSYPCAHYDLIQYKGQKGVFSQDVRQSGEEFYTLSEIIGYRGEYQGSSSVPIDFENIMQGFKELMHNEEFYGEEVLQLSKDFAKMLILDTYCMSTDRHTENCGVIIVPGENGKKHIKFAPLIDNECSLMLDIPIYELEEMNQSAFGIDYRADVQEPLIALSDENSEPGISKWQDMLEFLTEKDEFFDFANLCNEKLDIEKAIRSVEIRTGVKIPDLAKDTAIKGFISRRAAIRDALLLDLTIDEPKKESDDIVI